MNEAGGDIMSPETLAAAHGIKVRTLAQYRFQRRGFCPPFHRVGRRIVYLRQEVLDWIRAHPGHEAQPDTGTVDA